MVYIIEILLYTEKSQTVWGDEDENQPLFISGTKKTNDYHLCSAFLLTRQVIVFHGHFDNYTNLKITLHLRKEKYKNQIPSSLPSRGD